MKVTLRAAGHAGRAAPRAPDRSDGQGVSVFVQDDGNAIHTYSAHSVDADVMLSTRPWNDIYGTPDRHEHHH